MKAPFKMPFWISALCMMAVIGGMLWSRFPRIEELFSGDVFTCEFAYVWSPYNYGYCFNTAVTGRFVMSLFLFAVAVVVICGVRWLTADLNRVQRAVFRFLVALVCLLPLSAGAIALVMISRLILDMGITPKRLFGLSCAAGNVLVILTFLWFAVRFREGHKSEQDGSSLPSRGRAGS